MMTIKPEIFWVRYIDVMYGGVTDTVTLASKTADENGDVMYTFLRLEDTGFVESHTIFADPEDNDDEVTLEEIRPLVLLDPGAAKCGTGDPAEWMNVAINGWTPKLDAVRGIKTTLLDQLVNGLTPPATPFDEPAEIGSMIVDQYSTVWTRYTNESVPHGSWISTDGRINSFERLSQPKEYTP